MWYKDEMRKLRQQERVQKHEERVKKAETETERIMEG